MQPTISFKTKQEFNLNCTINYLMQVIYHLCSKSTIPSKHQYIHPFPVKLHKNAPFLIKSRSHNLRWHTISHWGTEVWKDQSQFTFSAPRILFGKASQWRRQSQSRRYGGALVGLTPQANPKSPQIETWSTINQWRFCQFLECQTTPRKRKVP